MEYELLFFASLANEAKIPEIKKEIEETITGQGGKISADFSDIGKRKLAYPIKKQTHAFFSFCRFAIEEKESLPELNRRLDLNDKIMRHIIVRASEIGKLFSTQTALETKSESREEKIKPAIDKKSKEPTEEKVGMAELDEKLEEILDETPS